MINGINPYTISRITWKRGIRFGKHPSWIKLMKKRHPIKGFRGFYAENFFSGFFKPTVKIFGSNGRVLQEIECRSNDHAKQLCEQLRQQLSDWVESSRA